MQKILNFILCFSFDNFPSYSTPNSHVETFLVKCSESSILLSPDQVVMFIPHAEKIDCIAMRERYDSDRRIRFDETYCLHTVIKINKIEGTNYRCVELLDFHEPFKKSLEVNDPEAR